MQIFMTRREVRESRLALNSSVHLSTMEAMEEVDSLDSISDIILVVNKLKMNLHCNNSFNKEPTTYEHFIYNYLLSNKD
jgi:hypothetical protein